MADLNLKTLGRMIGQMQAEIAALKRRKAHHEAAARRLSAAMRFLIHGDARAVQRKAAANGTAAKPRGSLSAWLLAQRLPQPLATLAAASKRAGFSGYPHAVAAAATHDPRLVRLKDGRIGRAKA